jgi:hypothetical protein
MRILKTFFHSFTNSLYNPEYYQRLRKTDFSFSVKYSLFLNFLISLVMMAMVMVPVSQFDVSGAIIKGFAAYPAELEIYGDEDGISINQDLPYSIPFPVEVFDDLGENDLEEFNFVTFDSDQNITGLDDFYKSDSIILVTETTLYAYEDGDSFERGKSGQVRVQPVTGIEKPFAFNVVMLNEFRDKIVSHPLFAQKLYLPIVAVGMMAVIFPIAFVFRFLTVAFYSVFAWIMSRMLFSSKNLTFNNLVQFGLHAITPLMLVAYLTSYTSNFDFSGWSYFVVYLVWMGFIMSKSANKAAGVTQSKPKAIKSKPKKTTKKVTKKSKKASPSSKK